MSTPTLSFDGTDDYVQTPVAANYGTSDFAVSGWVNLDSVPDSNSRTTIASTYDGSGWILGPAFGEWRFWTTNGNNAVGGPPETDVWQHLCGVRDGSGNLTLYLDGEVITTGTSSSDVTNTTDVYIGAESDQSHVIDGQLDDVRIFNTSLTQEEVRDVMNGQILGTENSIWMMNEGTGTTLTNAAQNSSGTINGATWSTRSGGNTYEWSTASDWDASQSHDDVNHDPNGVAGYGEEVIVIGQQYDHLTTTSEEAYYIVRGPNINPETLSDESPANNDGTINGATKDPESNYKFTGSVDFDGSDDTVKLPSTIQSSGTTIATELWFYPRSTGSQILFDSKDFYTIFYDRYGNGRMNIGVFGDNFTPTNVPPLNTWNHLNMYWDVGNEIGVSINGDPWETYATSETVDNQSNPRYLGSSSNSFYFDGRMTEIRFVAGQQIPIDESLYQINGTLTTGRKT